MSERESEADGSEAASEEPTAATEIAPASPGNPAPPPSTRTGSLEAPRTRRRKGWLVVGIGLAAVLLLGMVAFVVVLTQVSTYTIPSASMSPAIRPGDRIAVTKDGPGATPHRGDIVVFDNPDPDGRVASLVARVVGLPNESLVIDDGHVYVDDHLIEEPYLATDAVTEAVGPHGCARSSPCLIPPDAVFVLGDNRTNSKDSRYYDAVPLSSIAGHAVAIYWPVGRISSL